MFRNNYSVCVEALRRPPWQWHKLARGVTDRTAVTLLSGSTCFPNRHRTVLRQAEGQGSMGEGSWSTFREACYSQEPLLYMC